MKKIFLLIILSITSYFKNYGQTNPYLRLIKIDWQKSYPDNSYIEKLFDKKQFDNIEIPDDKINTVYDRGELESMINYEENRLSFDKIYQLSKNKNWLNNELEFSFSKVSGNWIVKDWAKKIDYIINSNEKISIEKFKKNHLDVDMILH